MNYLRLSLMFFLLSQSTFLMGQTVSNAYNQGYADGKNKGVNDGESKGSYNGYWNGYNKCYADEKTKQSNYEYNSGYKDGQVTGPSYPNNQLITTQDSIFSKQIDSKKLRYGGSGSIIIEVKREFQTEYYKICRNVVVDCNYIDKPSAKKAIMNELYNIIGKQYEDYQTVAPINYDIDECEFD